MGLICSLLNVYIIVVIAGVLLSWFPSQPGGSLAQIREVIYRLTEPVMGPVRRAIGTNFGGIDFSPLIVIIGLQILASLIC